MDPLGKRLRKYMADRYGLSPEDPISVAAAAQDQAVEDIDLPAPMVEQAAPPPSPVPASKPPPAGANPQVWQHMLGRVATPEELDEADAGAAKARQISGLGKAGMMLAQTFGAKNADSGWFDQLAQDAEGRRKLVSGYLKQRMLKGAELNAEQQKATADAQRDYDKEMRGRSFTSEQNELNRRSNERAAALSAGNAAAARTDKSVTDLAKSLEDAAGLKADMATLVEAAKKKDVPSVGPMDKWTPTFMQGEDAIRTEQAAGRVLAALLKIQSGVSVSPQELQRAMKARGLQGGSEEAFRIGVEAMLAELGTAMRQKEAGYPADVSAELGRRGGITSKDLPAYKTGTQSAPAATVVETRQAPDGRIIELLSDGTKRVR